MPLRVTNPFNQETIVELPHDEGSRIEKKISLAHGAFAKWRRVPLEERARHVSESIARFRGMAEDIARDALSLGAAKLPIKTRFIQRIAE